MIRLIYKHDIGDNRINYYSSAFYFVYTALNPQNMTNTSDSPHLLVRIIYVLSYWDDYFAISTKMSNRTLYKQNKQMGPILTRYQSFCSALSLLLKSVTEFHDNSTAHDPLSSYY